MEGNEESAMVVDLIPWTEYEFRVIATNTLGTGEPSSPSAKERTTDAGKSRGPRAGPLEVNGIYLPSRDVPGVARKRSWKTTSPSPRPTGRSRAFHSSFYYSTVYLCLVLL